MKKIQYLALLRGINVGGNNIIKMADLKACFENMGFEDVVTYIQSGNILFSSKEKNLSKLLAKIETGLTKEFNYKPNTVIFTYKQLKDTVENAPKGFGKNPEKYRYDVIFLKESINSKEIIKTISLKEGVDQAYAGDSVIYFSRLVSKITQSHLPKIINLPVYKNMTIRNWNSTTKLFSLMNQ